MEDMSNRELLNWVRQNSIDDFVKVFGHKCSMVEIPTNINIGNAIQNFCNLNSEEQKRKIMEFKKENEINMMYHAALYCDILEKETKKNLKSVKLDADPCNYNIKDVKELGKQILIKYIRETGNKNVYGTINTYFSCNDEEENNN